MSSFEHPAGIVGVSFLIQRVLWVDCIGALSTGIAMLLLSGWLSVLYGLPRAFVMGHAFVHLIYGFYSFSLAVRQRRKMAMLLLLIFANAVWGGLCLIFAADSLLNASGFAAAHFIVEGIYVGTLALIEWKQRGRLASNE